MTRRIVIVRHGNTFAPGEAPRRIGARTDLPLVESGRAQAIALGSALASAGVRPNAILASPLKRATETAERIAQAFPALPPVESAPWLREIDYGCDEGKAEPLVMARVGEAAMAAWNASGQPPPGWQVDRAGAISAWQSFFMAAAPGDTICVTSNGIARFALLTLPAQPESAAGEGEGLTLRTGAASLITVGDDEPPRLVFWNRRPEDLGAGFAEL